MVPTFAAPLPGILAMVEGIKRWTRSTLMSRFNGWRHGYSSPIRSEARCPPNDRAWQGAAAETTVDHTLMRGLATAGPRFVSGLPRSRGGTSVTGPIVDHEGSPS